MDWTDVLKVQVLGNKQKVKQGIKPLPKNEEDSCLKRLERWVAKLDTLQSKYPPTDDRSISTNGMLFMTEDSACNLLKELNRAASEYLSRDGSPHGRFKWTFLNTYSQSDHEPKIDLRYGNSYVSDNGINLIIRWTFIDVNPGTIDDGVEFKGTLHLMWDSKPFGFYSVEELDNIMEELIKLCKEA